MAEDVVLDPIIKGRHLEPALVSPQGIALAQVHLRTRGPLPTVGPGAGHKRHAVYIVQAGPFPGLADHDLRVFAPGGDEPLHGSVHPQLTGQAAGVDALHAQHAVLFQEIGQGGPAPPVGKIGLVLLDYERLHMDLAGFHVLGAGPVVADQRIGHGHHLELVGGIGQDLLVAGHGGVETHFGQGLALARKRSSLEDRPVFQSQNGLHGFNLSDPAIPGSGQLIAQRRRSFGGRPLRPNGRFFLLVPGPLKTRSPAGPVRRPPGPQRPLPLQGAAGPGRRNYPCGAP